MKNKLMTGLLVLLSIALFISCRGRGDTSVSIYDSEDIYSLTATYPDYKTERVEQFMNRAMRNSLFNSGDNVIDALTVLDDQTRLHIKSESGRLKLRFDKRQNTDSALQRMKKMCQGIKNVLTER
jgi:hypothetical protein